MTRTIEAFGSWHRDLGADIRSPALTGILAIAIMIGGGGVWATVAPLSGAVMAKGTIVATGQNRTVQHLEGGIIGEIVAREGELVDEGQVVLRLNRTAAEASLRRLEDQYALLLATRARHLAERNGSIALIFPDGSPAERLIFASQRSEFEARRERLAAEISVLRKQIAARSEEIDGIAAQRKSASDQAALIAEELVTVRGLYSKGLAQKPRVLALERSAAQLLGTEGELTARLAQARQFIAEVESRILNVRSAFKEKVAAELSRTEAELADVGERLKAVRDIAERIEVKAPVRGVVVKLHVNTAGGVIRPGEPVMDILPSDGGLEVEAKVSPADVDEVHPGRPAQLRFTGLRQRITPTVAGEVHYVSADRLIDVQTQQAFYVARIRMAELPAELQGLALMPGMPVDVFVETGERTFLEYMLAPVSDSLARAFRER